MPEKITFNEVEIARDEMSSRSQIQITIPQFPDLSEDVVADKLRELALEQSRSGNPTSLEDTAQFVAQNEPIPGDAQPLSKDSYLLSAKRLLALLEEEIEAIPEEWRSAVRKAANHGFRIGKTIEHLRNRDQHIKKVVTGSKIHNASSEGGRAKKGQYSEVTPKILEKMDQLVAEGKSVRSAARIVHRRDGLGTNDESNRSIYRAHRPNPRKKTGGLLGKPPTG